MHVTAMAVPTAAPAIDDHVAVEPRVSAVIDTAAAYITHAPCQSAELEADDEEGAENEPVLVFHGFFAGFALSIY
jgi:hypothetical protein